MPKKFTASMPVGKLGFVVAPGQRVDPCRSTLAFDQFSRDLHRFGQIQHRAVEFRKGLRDEHGISSRAAADVQQFLATGEVEGAAPRRGRCPWRVRASTSRRYGCAAGLRPDAIGGVPPADRSWRIPPACPRLHRCRGCKRMAVERSAGLPGTRKIRVRGALL